MPIKTPAQRSTLATSYGAAATEARLYSTVPDTTAGTAIVGAAKAVTWGAPAVVGSASVVTATVVFDVPAGATVAGAGVHNSAGAYLDGGALPSQPFASAGTYTLTLTYTQS